MNERDIFLNGEADAWFLRNKDTIIKNGASDGTKIFLEFMKNQISIKKHMKYWKLVLVMVII